MDGILGLILKSFMDFSELLVVGKPLVIALIVLISLQSLKIVLELALEIEKRITMHRICKNIRLNQASSQSSEAKGENDV
jgi:hypothetical protein